MHNIKPLKTQLNPICHLLALLGAHNILHVGRIRVKHKESQSVVQQTWDSSVSIVTGFIFRGVSKIAKSDYYVKVRLYYSMEQPAPTSQMDVFSRNLKFQYFEKICKEISSFIKFWQEERVLHVKFCLHW
jgi:hypothetical protein